MRKEQTRQHCPEVERLMGGRLPFVTRHGVTVIAILMITAGICLLMSHGYNQQLAREILSYTIEQITSKYK